MDREDILEIGLDLNAISNMVDDETYQLIKGRLDDIEQIVSKYVGRKEKEQEK